MFKFHYPERGRKRSQSGIVKVQIPLPRKGTETETSFNGLQRRVFKFHYPERGRKQNPSSDYIYKPIVQIPLPRKGTETCHGLKANSIFVQIPLPRKGTETLGSLFPNHDDTSSNSITPKGDGNCYRHHHHAHHHTDRSNSITPKGDGNVDHVVDSSNCVKVFKFHYPERGRKR